jgi:hypothetical protein
MSYKHSSTTNNNSNGITSSLNSSLSSSIIGRKRSFIRSLFSCKYSSFISVIVSKLKCIKRRIVLSFCSINFQWFNISIFNLIGLIVIFPIFIVFWGILFIKLKLGEFRIKQRNKKREQFREQVRKQIGIERRI